MDQQSIIECTRRWIAEVVIALNLCPFARSVFQAGQIRYVVSAAENEKTLLQDLTAELQALASTPATQVETTILIHPAVLGDFLAYNDFLDEAEQLVENLGLSGILQIASFHPEYQFAGTVADAVENFTNRSPFPMLQLIREETFDKLEGDPNELLEIPKRNIATLKALGREKILAKLRSIISAFP
jgi:uncharacterized protein